MFRLFMIGATNKTLRGAFDNKPDAIRAGRRLRREYLGWPQFEIEDFECGEERREIVKEKEAVGQMRLF